jgi:glutamyl-tRNA reductase
MTANGDTDRRLLVFGVNHRSATAALRERLLVAEIDQPALLTEVGAAGFDQALLLATCDRLEVVTLHEDPESAVAPLLEMFAEWAQVTEEELRAQSYRHLDEAALRHIFAVAASLDSQVIGEPQVLGQVKESHRLATAADVLGPGLEAVMQAAYAAAKRVRSETPVAERPDSITASALMVARNLHGDVAECSALVVGLGDMGELMALELKDAGVGELILVHGSAARAEAAAHRLRCHFRPWEELAEALSNADIVVTALGSGRHTVTVSLVETALKKRRRRPILFIDSAVPGDVEPAVQALDGAFVYDLDDLEDVARDGKATREATALAAWRVIEEELAAFRRRRAERAAVPAVAALRQHFEAVRAEVLSQSGLDAEVATRLLVKRLLHAPSEALRAAAAGDPEAARELERATERLFRIDDPASEFDTQGGEEKGEERTE